MSKTDVAVVAVETGGNGRYDRQVHAWIPGYRLRLECGHVVTRTAKDPAMLPGRVPCRKCAVAGKTIPGQVPTHSELCAIAEKWLRNSRGCSAVLVELVSAAGEQPDAIGWRWHESMLVECKTSRADFRADLKKLSRRHEEDGWGPGRLRWYLAPAGVIPVEELPPLWGLLVWDGRCVHEVKAAEVRKESNRGMQQEILLLTSALRRVQSPGAGADPSPA